MKLEIGVPDYRWHGGELAAASLKGRMPNRPVPVMVMEIDELLERRKRLQFARGVPTAVAVDISKQRLWCFPTPDGEYELVTVDREADPKPQEGAAGSSLRGTLSLPKKDDLSKPAKARGS